MSSTCLAAQPWSEFLEFARQKCSAAAFENWLAPIVVKSWDGSGLVLEVPNIFVQQYLFDNFRQDLCAFLPVKSAGQPAVEFVIVPPEQSVSKVETTRGTTLEASDGSRGVKLNPLYRFGTFIEGPSNQFVKSACMGVASRPGQSYNPLFIHGGVGLGKTHLLHSIGHYIQDNHPKLRMQCITTEALINDMVDSLKRKSIDKLKRFYRNLDVLLVDDIQFLQQRLSFEEEFCNTFEALINRGGLIVITSDQPPGRLKLSERMVARMEWGLVTSVNQPDLETRVAILLHKAEAKGLTIPQQVAFFIAEHIYSNVRQLEGAINRLSAYCRLLDLEITEELVERTLKEMLSYVPLEKVTVEQVLKSVAAVFQVSVPELRGQSRTKEIALPRQVAMYLAREMVKESLMMIAASFGGRRHSTVLHACARVEGKITNDERLRRQIDMVRRNLQAA